MPKITSWNQAGFEIRKWVNSSHDSGTPNYKHLFAVFQHYANRQYYYEEQFKDPHGAFTVRPADRLIWLELMLVYPELSIFSVEEIANLWYEAKSCLGGNNECLFVDAIKEKYPKVEFKAKLNPEMQKLVALEEQNKAILKELAELRSLILTLSNK